MRCAVVRVDVRQRRLHTMKKFTFKGVLDGIRSSVAPQIKPDQEIVETLRSDNFQVAKVSGTANLNYTTIYCHYERQYRRSR